MIDLTKNEETLLIAILHLEENAYGVFIRKRIKEITGRQWNFGTIYRMLDQLLNKGLLIRKDGELLPNSIGRRKKFYTLTKCGLDALQMSYNNQKKLWDEKILTALKNG